MTAITQPDLQATMAAWDQAAWSLAALALAARGDSPPDLAAAAGQVLSAAGLTSTPEQRPGLGISTAEQIASQAAAPLHQVSALLAGRPIGWAEQSDEALLAQGSASAQMAPAFARFLLPMMGDLAARLAAPGARMLDVGTGVGAQATGFAQSFAQLHVVGIDVLDRALDLARQAIAAGGVADRVTVCHQDVADLTDDDGYDLVFLPAPFIPPPALYRGLARVAAALRPGGWLMVGHGKFGGTQVEDAVTRLKTVAFGGTPVDDAAACQLLRGADLTSVRSVPTPAGAPAITVGQRPG